MNAYRSICLNDMFLSVNYCLYFYKTSCILLTIVIISAYI
jgi:hypothetical protein